MGVPDGAFGRTFCILPWMHLYVGPGGEVLPCCIGAWDLPLGNVRERSLEEVWNGEPFRRLRDDLLHGRESPHCRACYADERAGSVSLRESCNADFRDEDEAITCYATPRWRYIDIRFNNVCNFKCRTCNAVFSSAWEEENRRHGRLVQSVGGEDVLLEQIMPVLDHVRVINFAGGEPLVSSEHAVILEALSAAKRFDVRLRYSTNISILDHGGRSTAAQWRDFRDVVLNASLDAVGPRGEYIRHGSRWRQQIENVKRLRLEAPHVDLRVASVISLFNVSVITDLLDSLAQEGILDLGQEAAWRCYLLKDPEEFNVRVLDTRTKVVAEERIRAWMEQNPVHPSVVRRLNDILGYLRLDAEPLSGAAKTRIDAIDARRSESFRQTFPELQSFYAQAGEPA